MATPVNELRIYCPACASADLIPEVMQILSPPIRVTIDGGNLAIQANQQGPRPKAQIRLRCGECNESSWLGAYGEEEGIVARLLEEDPEVATKD